MKQAVLVTKWLILILVVVLFSACKVMPPRNNVVDDQIDNTLQQSIANNQYVNQQKPIVPDAISNALMPKFNTKLPNAKQASERRFDVAVQNVPAAQFFMGLVKGTKYNMVVSPKVKGTISLNLKNVTIHEVMDAVRDVYGYEYQQVPYGFQVLPRHLETRIFTVNYLDIDRAGQSDTTISSGQITRKITGQSSDQTSTTSSETEAKPSSNVTTSSDANFWKVLHETLKTMIGDKDGHAIIVNPQAGTVIVRAYPNELREVSEYLDQVQNIMDRQVIIEAKVLEVELNANYQAGIDWNVLGLRQGSGDTDINDNLKALTNSIFTLNISNGWAFNSVIKLLNTQGRVNVLSSPRIATVNNQKAVIKIGQDEFFVTNVSSTTTDNTSTTGSDQTQDVDLTPFFSGIALDVTPQIDAHGIVTLHIHPIISDVTEQKKEFKVSGEPSEVPLAKSSIRESDSVVRAHNGQVIVIGGLMENNAADYNAGTPGAEDLPSIGGLFKNTNRRSGKFELVILLRPIVVGANTWTKSLREAAHTFNAMPKDFGYDAKVALHNKRNQ